MTHFLTLGLPRSATLADVKKAHRRLVRRLHPDLAQTNGLRPSRSKAQEVRMASVNAAYEALKTEERIAAYRAELEIVDREEDEAPDAAGRSRAGSQARPEPGFGHRAAPEADRAAGRGFGDFFTEARRPDPGRADTGPASGATSDSTSGQGRPDSSDPASGPVIPWDQALFLPDGRGQTIRLFVDAPLRQGRVEIRLPRFVRDGKTIRQEGHLDKVVFLTHPVRAGEVLEIAGSAGLALVRTAAGRQESWNLQIEVAPSTTPVSRTTAFQVRAEAAARFHDGLCATVAGLMLPICLVIGALIFS